MYNNFYPLPNDLDIVYCRFLDRQRVPALYPLDPHYCLVLGQDTCNHAVIVSFGTSKIKNNSNNNIILTKQDLKNTCLTKDTQWSFAPDGIAILEYNDFFFENRKFSPICGKFPPHKKNDLLNILQSAQVKLIIDDLWDSGSAILPKSSWNSKKYIL